jgi:hypothetical protein
MVPAPFDEEFDLTSTGKATLPFTSAIEDFKGFLVESGPLPGEKMAKSNHGSFPGLSAPIGPKDE